VLQNDWLFGIHSICLQKRLDRNFRFFFGYRRDFVPHIDNVSHGEFHLTLPPPSVASRCNTATLKALPGSCFGGAADGCVRVCSFDCAPGLYVLPSALSVDLQRDLAVHAYTTLASPQHDCSLQSTHSLPSEGTLLQHWKDALGCCCGADDGVSAVARTAADDAFHLNDSTPPHLAPFPRDAAGIERVLRKLRWIALGYRYNWDSLSYDWNHQPLPLPACICRVAEDCVQLLRQPPVSLQCSTYKPQAAVVNFYQIGDSLTSHVDRSEPAAAAPLVCPSAQRRAEPSHLCSRY
jgi:alkylated DNA repair dioxygenase AlkB